MALIRLTKMNMRSVYVNVNKIGVVERSTSSSVGYGGKPCTDVFIDGEDEPIEVRTRPGRIARLVREATSWVELP